MALTQEQLEAKTKVQLLEMLPQGTSKNLKKDKLVQMALAARVEKPETEEVKAEKTPAAQPDTSKAEPKPPKTKTPPKPKAAPKAKPSKSKTTEPEGTKPEATPEASPTPTLAQVLPILELDLVRQMYRACAFSNPRSKHSRDYLESVILDRCQDEASMVRVAQVMEAYAVKVQA